MKKTIATIAAFVFCATLFSASCARGEDDSFKMDATDIGYAVGIVTALSIFLYPLLHKTEEPIEEKKPPLEEPAKTRASITSGMDVSESSGRPALLYAVKVKF